MKGCIYSLDWTTGLDYWTGVDINCACSKRATVHYSLLLYGYTMYMVHTCMYVYHMSHIYSVCGVVCELIVSTALSLFLIFLEFVVINLLA